VFAANTNGPLYRVPAAGGSAAPVTRLDQSREEVSHRFPWFLPDGHHFLYTGRSTDPGKNAIYVSDTESEERRQIIAVSSNAAYAPPGFLLFVRERTLMADSFDERKLQLKGEPFPVAEPVEFITGNVQGSFSVSQNGTVAYYSGGAGTNSLLTWFDRTGKASGTIGPPGSYFAPAISPDGRTLAADALDSRTGTYDIWLYDLARNTASRFTTDPKHDDHPVWSPDGSSIVFSSDRSGHYDLYRKSVNGAEKEQVLVESPFAKFASDWTRDGRFILFYQLDPNTKYDLWLLPRSGDAGAQKPVPLLQTQFNESWAKVSPDGRWFAYTSDETGASEVYVQSFPSLGGKWKVSVDGGSRPVWSRDGKELFYISRNQKLMTAAVKAGSRFETSTPKPLLDAQVGSSRLFDVSPDGQRFLVINPIEEPAAPPMTVVVNWNAAIHRN
jgi:Tol biopolymer transport system component